MGRFVERSVGLFVRLLQAFQLEPSQVSFDNRHLQKLSLKNVDFLQMKCLTFLTRKPLAKEGKEYVRNYVTLGSIRND